MQSPAPGKKPAEPRRSARPLWVLLALCVAPIVASYVAYYIWQPEGQVNYGELLEPRLLPDVELVKLDGDRLRVSDLRGRWVFVTADTARCAEACVQKLVYSRQIRLAQPRDSDRIERLWVITDGGVPDPALLREHEGLIVARDASGALLATLPAARAPTDHVYVIDPLGHVMLRFPENPDPRRMLKDVSRLLRHSKWK